MSKGTKFDESFILKMQQKGLFVTDPVMEQKLNKVFDTGVKIPKSKKVYSNKEKDHIEWVLIGLKVKYVKEYKFHPTRKWKFDWAIPELMCAVEFEGVMSEHSRHTSVTGFSGDTTKYNEAAKLRWIVLRYTVLTYKNVGNDIEHFLRSK